jgi:hypothetical protein
VRAAGGGGVSRRRADHPADRNSPTRSSPSSRSRTS